MLCVHALVRAPQVHAVWTDVEVVEVPARSMLLVRPVNRVYEHQGLAPDREGGTSLDGGGGGNGHRGQGQVRLAHGLLVPRDIAQGQDDIHTDAQRGSLLLHWQQQRAARPSASAPRMPETRHTVQGALRGVTWFRTPHWSVDGRVHTLLCQAS